HRGEQLMQRMNAAVLMTSGGVLMLHWHAGTGGFHDIQRRAVATEDFCGRPFGQHGKRRRRMRTELLRRVNNFSADDSENRFDGLDLFFRRGEVVLSESDEVRQLTHGNRALLSALARKPTA